MVFLKLMSLNISNFKGITALNLHLDGKNAVISGRNGEGKTSILDAICWLMTGKDSGGNQPESEAFQIKPRTKQGAVLSGVMPTVTAVFDVNGQTLTLQKVFKERWEKRRGQSEEVFSGHTTEYYIDSIPRKESEYKDILTDYIGEDVFRLLTDVYRFPMQLKWQERREILFKLCNIQTDAEIMTQDSRFTELAQNVGRWSVDEYKAGLRNQRKKINQQLEALPIRIDENEKSVAELEMMDFDLIRIQLTQVEEQIKNYLSQIVEIDNNTALITLKNEVEALNNQLVKLENDNNLHRMSQKVPTQDLKAPIKQKISMTEMQIRNEQFSVKKATEQIDSINKTLEQYRAKWKQIAAEKFSGDTVCHACGQPLPADSIHKAQAHFEQDKKARQNRLLEDSNILKQHLEKEQNSLDTAQKAIEELTVKLNELKQELEQVPPEQIQIIEDLPEYKTEFSRIQGEIRAKNQALSEVANDAVSHKQHLQEKLNQSKELQKQLHSQLAAEDQLTAAKRRTEELHSEQRSYAAQLDNIDKMIALCEEFVRYKVDSITNSINSKFSLATFRLFRVQINGGLEDCCDVMLDGKPYGTISDGEKIKVGIDIVKTLSDYYGAKVPLIVDYAESVTDFPQTDWQTIKLMVKDAKLEVTQ